MKTIFSEAKYNKDRKKVLEDIDNKDFKSLNIFKLGYLGLTTYFERIEETPNESLFDKIYRVKQCDFEIKHLSGLEKTKRYFMPLQVDAYNHIVNNKYSIVSAPTSFGKTLIVKEYIYVHKPKVVVFIVPTNALAYELEESFKENNNFSDYVIFDKAKSDEVVGRQKELFIGTQEKYLEISELFEYVDLFVIDEAYKLQDSILTQRGYKLSKSFLDTAFTKSEKVCLLTPNATLIGFSEFGFQEFKTDFNAVDKIFKRLDEPNYYSVLNEVSLNEKTILYCKTPNDIGNIETRIDDHLHTDNHFLNSLINDFHKEWSVVKLLKKGVLVHNGAMPKYIQNKMLNLFNKDSAFNLLIGTNSISEGINTPTKHLFIMPNCQVDSNLLLIKNTIGRAGRLGTYPIGHIYSVEEIEQKVSRPIEIAVSFIEEGLSEFEDTNNENKVETFCKEHQISIEFYHFLITKYNVSLRRLGRILKSLEGDQLYDDHSQIVWIASNVFSGEPNRYAYARQDKIFIKGLLQKGYLLNPKDKSTFVNINSFQDKIDFFKFKAKDKPDLSLTDSEIVDGYIRLQYSSLDHDIYPVAAIAKDIYDNNNNWIFGKNVVTIYKSFLKRYRQHILGLSEEEELSDIENKILFSIREYGINPRASGIDKTVLDEIADQLNERFSTYDIVNAIKRLKSNSKSRKYVYEQIIEKYF